MTSIPLPQEPDDSRGVVRSIDADGNLVFRQVGIEEINHKGRFNALVTSGTQATIGIGEFFFTLDEDNGNFRVGDDVQIIAQADPDCYMWGEVIGKDTTTAPARLRIYVDDISRDGGTFAGWEIQVVARPKPGIEKDTSTTSIDPTGAGPFTFTVTAGKFFPIGGKLLIKALEDRTVVLIGKVEAYSGTSLVVTKNATNATGSTSYTSWAIALLDAPQDKIQKYSINGLRVSQNFTDWKDIDVQAGSVRDSTDTIDLILPSSITKRLDAAFAAGTNQGAYTVSANLSGTISTAGIDVTGTGTNFIGELYQAGAVSPYSADLLDQFNKGVLIDNAYGDANAEPNIISGGVSASFSNSGTSDTIGFTSVALGVSGATYARGGWVVTNGRYAICVVRKDTDGSIDVCASSFAPNGEPDLPSGYTYYRAIAYVVANDSEVIIHQPLKTMNAPRAYEVAIQINGHVASSDNVYEAIEAIYSGVEPLATVAKAGIVELATIAETQAGTNSTRAIHPSGLAGLSGAYTPTTTTNVNLDADPTLDNHFYLRLGEYVFVWGGGSADPTTAAGTVTSFRLSLPVSTTFASATQAKGPVVQQHAALGGGHVESVSGTSRVLIEWLANGTTNRSLHYSFAYKIL